MANQDHHLIPLNVIRDHPLFKAMRAGNPQAGIAPVAFNGFKLELPNYGDSALNYHSQIFHRATATHYPSGSLSPCGLTSVACSANVLFVLIAL